MKLRLKSAVSILLLTAMLFVMAGSASAAVSWETGYYQYLRGEDVYDEGKVVAMAFVNLNGLGNPELIYAYKTTDEGTALRICQFIDGEVDEKELDYDDLYITPTALHINKYKSKTSSTRSYLLYCKTKSTKKRNEKIHVQINMQGNDVINKRLLRESYISKRDIDYFYNQQETPKARFTYLKNKWLGERKFIVKYPMYFMGKKSVKNFKKMYNRAISGYEARKKY